MSVVLNEERLQFAFDDGWKVLKWDKHQSYLDGIQKLPGTKAVDFFGLYIGEPWFIEVKDFREYRIDNKQRLSTGDLAREVACKVRDTLAGMVWACRRAPHDEARELEAFVKPLVNRSGKLPVVLWLEEDRPTPTAAASTLGEAIRRELTWLNARVLVTSRALSEDKPFHGIVVTALPTVKNPSADQP